MSYTLDYLDQVQDAMDALDSNKIEAVVDLLSGF